MVSGNGRCRKCGLEKTAGFPGISVARPLPAICPQLLGDRPVKVNTWPSPVVGAGHRFRRRPGWSSYQSNSSSPVLIPIELYKDWTQRGASRARRIGFDADLIFAVGLRGVGEDVVAWPPSAGARLIWKTYLWRCW